MFKISDKYAQCSNIQTQAYFAVKMLVPPLKTKMCEVLLCCIYLE